MVTEMRFYPHFLLWDPGKLWLGWILTVIVYLKFFFLFMNPMLQADHMLER